VAYLTILVAMRRERARGNGLAGSTRAGRTAPVPCRGTRAAARRYPPYTWPTVIHVTIGQVSGHCGGLATTLGKGAIG
jgi:hypothetical protein